MLTTHCKALQNLGPINALMILMCTEQVPNVNPMLSGTPSNRHQKLCNDYNVHRTDTQC